MRQLHFDLLRLLEDDRRGSHASRRTRCHVLAQAPETLHELGYRGLRARGFTGISSSPHRVPLPGEFSILTIGSLMFFDIRSIGLGIPHEVGPV